MMLYNTLTRQVEELVPLEPGKYKIYSCGPTVYRYIHIGNLRTFTMADWLRRTLQYRGNEVLHIKNITDVGHMRMEMLDRGEDKLIAQARKEGKTSAEIAAFYTGAFLEDEAALNILPAHVFPRATEHVPRMLEIIRDLLAKDTAYEINGNVYFDISRFPGYGKLSGNQLANLLEGVREDTDSNKRNPEDFALWKLAEPGREMAWDSPWGRGFPGWHIECSAMSFQYLGSHFDIHTGGVDNIFPHHEDEIAQSEGWTGRKFVNYWVHAQHLLADGQKMAKSTGNAYTRADVVARGFDPLALRYFYTTALYRSRINFTFGALQAAQTGLDRLRFQAARLQAEAGTPSQADQSLKEKWTGRFLAALENDLNLPQAMAVVWQMLRSPSRELSPAARLELLLDWDQVLGFGLEAFLESDHAHFWQEPRRSLKYLPPDLASLVSERSLARQQANYARADQLRQMVREAGFVINDNQAGPLVLLRALNLDFKQLSRWQDAPDNVKKPDRYEFSINLLAQNSRADLQCCLASLSRYAAGRSLEIVIIDNGSTDDTLPYLQQLLKEGLKDAQTGAGLGLQVLFADHNMGFAAGRNATFRASQGRFIVMLDTSIELKAEIWSALAQALTRPEVGLAGPYGLVTTDLKEYQETAGPTADAIEGYLLAFRRELLSQVFPIDEKFRFYRLMDVYFSFFFKSGGYEVIVLPEVARRLEKHPHREWFNLSEEERQTKSKKNFDILKARWHHGQSLLVANFEPQNRWAHDAQGHVQGVHSHSPAELPPPGQPHRHKHQHWPDHDHEHEHYHVS
jgi:cysteinyl-tRNA synthetase